ncbi:MAG: MBOAT family protein, partial [Pseudomonadota bacterium]|nr:MBOAT family protein [Pseudomonadota bacterium]
YAVQIYCDFSAYSDIAIGLAALLGYYFPPNFDQPYRAQSLREFWRRWHMSLSFWLRDYLYKPLGGSRGGSWFTARNLMITMLLGGVWHGAAWKFVIWGALHGGALTAERYLAPTSWGRSPLARVLATVLVFHFVCFAWIFFRADSFEGVIIYLKALAEFRPGVTQLSPFTLALIALGMTLQFVSLDLVKRLLRAATVWPEWALGTLAGVGIVAISAMGPDGVAPFIYFQF